MGFLRNVLLVDDKCLFREAVAAMLEREGYHVTIALDEADLQASFGAADAIVLNLAASSFDVEGFLEAQHKDQRLEGRPVIVILSAAGRSAKVRLSLIGVKHLVLRGDSTLADVLKTVRTLAGKPLAA